MHMVFSLMKSGAAENEGHTIIWLIMKFGGGAILGILFDFLSPMLKLANQSNKQVNFLLETFPKGEIKLDKNLLH